LEVSTNVTDVETLKPGSQGRAGDITPTTVATPSRRRDGTAKNQDKNANGLEELMRKRGIDEAWNALEEMQGQGINTDKYTISRMLMKTVGDGRSRMNTQRVYRGIGLVEKFIDVQPKDVDEVLLNALLDTCCRLKDLARLESVVQRMRELKVTPSPVTLGILVKTYGQAGDIEKVLQVWDEMEAQRGQANAVTFGCMIDACVKCNRLDKAVEIFASMRSSGKHRNTILYTTMIKGYGLNKDVASALKLFREMAAENVPYNTITYNSIIDACVKGGDLLTAETLLHEIAAPTSNLEPDLITFSTLLKGYCHAGDLDKALQLVDGIKARGLRCDELVYNTLMDGCVKANDVAAGVGLFEEMVQNGMRPSTITHSILARLYQRAGYEDDAAEAVAQLYRHHGVERPMAGEGQKGGKGSGKGRRGSHQRSPFGSGAASPAGSPMSGYGMHQNDMCWNSWGEMSYDGYGNPSAASTPCGSPMHQTGGHGNCMYFNVDQMQAMPPLPGMGGSEYGTPMSSQMASPYTSFQGSPCMSPANSIESQMPNGMMPMPGGSPQHSQVQFTNGPMSTAPLPQLPPFPCSGPHMGNMQQMPPADMNNQQCGFFTMQQQGAPQMMQQQSPMNGSMPQQPQMMQPSSGDMTCGMPQHQPQMMQPSSGAVTSAPFNAGPNLCWQQSQNAPGQQSPFPMPLSPPHDLAHSCAPSQPQQSMPQQQPQQQAYFDFMPGSGQGQTPTMQMGGGPGPENPFCL